MGFRAWGSGFGVTAVACAEERHGGLRVLDLRVRGSCPRFRVDSTLGLRLIKKKKRFRVDGQEIGNTAQNSGFAVEECGSMRFSHLNLRKSINQLRAGNLNHYSIGLYKF